MGRRLLSPMPAGITDAQRAASDPRQSVWVSANAGSGKTYVLTARVLRLLLSGVRPDEVLCLTYTKAAAAEMRGRVAERLGSWTLMSDAELEADLADLAALAGAPPDARMLGRARALFARALETPGGLRIQTIHAFCEAVLHRFPREAGVPFDFAVIEDHEREGLLRAAREGVIAEALRGGAHAEAVDTLFGLLSDSQIGDAIIEALSQQRLLRQVLADPDAARRALRRLLGDVGTPEDIRAELSTGYGLDMADHAAIFAAQAPDPEGAGFVDLLSAIDPASPDPDAVQAAFLTKTGTRRARLLNKGPATALPHIAARCEAEAERVAALRTRMVAALLLQRSDAMLTLVAGISAHYEAAKRARSLLDFDDLIEKLAALLGDEAQGAWVRYKLDAGLSHILVDEGQDTNRRQWEVVGALVDDFFVGMSAADRPRTLFAVGDQKQSIYSFQGADPEEFISAGRQYAFSARAAEFEVRQVPLHYSFRTLPNVLKAVDAVFAHEELQRAALEDAPPHHDTARAEGGGRVELWPPVGAEQGEIGADDWPTAPPAATQSAERRHAERIARHIREWLDARRPLGPRGRAIRPDDILILVQVRGVLFREIIRALAAMGIPTPGADRLAVTRHIGVLDMMALADVLTNPADDLQLAALLRSPLFDVTEDELYELARPRAEGQWLWQAMETSPIASVREAYERLSAWRDRLDFERPFNFYADVLYAGGGLRRMRARFGGEIDDVMAEFLDLALTHEQATQPSLLGFLAELRAREVIIKRELAESGGGVRVMTVHGSKGLEAPVVILADAASTERGRDRRSVYLSAVPPLFIHAGSKAVHTDETQEFRDEAETERLAEYWRKLYVAMTRAEDELYVTGYLTRTGTGEGSWYEAVERALAPQGEVLRGADGEVEALVFPSGLAAPATGAAPEPVVQTGPEAAPMLAPLPVRRAVPIIRPSTLDTPAVDVLRALSTRAEDAVDPALSAETARASGMALHALLQHLVPIAPDTREAVALRALDVLLPKARERHAGLVAKAISILSRPEFAELFGPDSRAELPFFAEALRGGERARIIGRMDRLVVGAGRVLVVDFKSDAAPPSDASIVPPAYLEQLALYARVAARLFPDRPVEAAILWTTSEVLMSLPRERLDAAAAGFTMG